MNAILSQVVSETARQMEALLREYPEIADDEQLKVDAFEGETSLNGIMQRLCNVLESTKALIAGASDQAKNIAKRKARFEARQSAVKDMMKKLLEAGKLTSLELPAATISITNRKRSAIITDQTLLPKAYVKTTITPMRDDIRAALIRGEIVPGAELNNGGISVTVRQS